MKISELLITHSHYWGVPHLRSMDRQLIQICYECGKERLVTVNLLQTFESSSLLL
jgi:hypothetical protein